MANTSKLKTFAQSTRAKLVSLITTKLHYLLNADNAELRGWEAEINRLRKTIADRGEESVVEEVAYTWFNRVMALRYMDSRGFNSPMVVSVAEGQTRPQILEDAMAGNFDEALNLKPEEKLLEGAPLYRRLLIALCNQNNASMPFLFEHLADYTELLLPDDLLSEQSFVTDIRRGMLDEDCQNVEIMGWLYQFYITDRKAEAEKNKSRRGGLKSDEQAAATQLFTPHWIVRYMVENSLGRIWMTLHPESDLISSMPYYIAPVEGRVDVIPEDIKSVADIRFLDPCMGSGHILVYAFDLFAKMYEEEGYQTKEIPSLILQNNIYGIDIDPRCYQLASFALTMKAREYYRRYLRNTVNPNVIALQSIDYQTIESTGSWAKNSLVWQMEHLDTIGSLLKVTPEEYAAISVDEGIFGQTQRLMKEQAGYLSGSYHCVVTNPPYLGKGIGDVLKSYITKEYPDSKADTMATFMERCADFCAHKGKWAMINMQSWMFLTTYETLRRNLLNTQKIDSLLHLGPHTFDEISGEIVQNAAFVVSAMNPIGSSIFFRLIEGRDCNDKKDLYVSGQGCYVVQDQTLFENLPDSVIGYWASNQDLLDFSTFNPMSNYANPRQGMSTCDVKRFVKLWYETNLSETNLFDKTSDKKWIKYNNGGGFRRWYGNRTHVVLWNKDGDLLRDNNAVLRNQSYYFMPFLSWNKIADRALGVRLFEEYFLFDGAGGSLFLNRQNDSLWLLGLLNSKPSRKLLSVISLTVNRNEAHIGALPTVIEENNTEIIKKIEDCFLISKQDWDAHETSWDFQTNELVRIAKEKGLTSLHQILAYYKREWEGKFMQLHKNEEEINREFIEIYGLQDELTPDVPLDEVTILQKGEKTIEDGELKWNDDAILKQLLSYLVGCFLGRYAIEQPGLVIANQSQHPEDLDFTPEAIEIDDDGIIPIIQDPDFFTDDMTCRIENAVEALFGKENKTANIRFIETALGCKLRDYFFKNFYADHTAMYSVKGAKRPIYWLFTSKMGDKKKKGYFKALVYMHRLEPDTLSKLHADYVVPYINALELHLTEAENELAREDLPNRKAVMTQADTLRSKIREVKEFSDELAKMASHRQTIDLDDGVAVNYPKFYPLLEPVKFPKQDDED